MAQLTEYIPGVTSGRGPSSGAPDPGLTAGAQVFGVIGDLVGLRQQRQQELDRQEDRAWNREQRDRARTEWGKQDRQEAAQDEIASAVFQVQRQEVENNRPGLPPITFNPPPSVVSAIQGLDKIRKAERQGRLPPGSTDIKLENVVSDVFTRYPDQTAEILDWMGARQYDHYLWREQKLAEAASANEAAVRTKTMDDVNKKGAELGWYDPFKTREENYSVIQPRIAEMTRTEEQRKLADAAMKQTEFTQGQTWKSPLGLARLITLLWVFVKVLVMIRNVFKSSVLQVSVLTLLCTNVVMQPNKRLLSMLLRPVLIQRLT